MSDSPVSENRGEIEDLCTEEEREEVGEFIEEMDGDDFRSLFHDGCEAENVYPEFGDGGSVYYHGMPEVSAWALELIRVEIDHTASIQDDRRSCGLNGHCGGMYGTQ